MPFVLADSLNVVSVTSERCAHSNGQVNTRCIVKTLMKEGNMPALTLRVEGLQKVVLKSALYTINHDVNWAVARNCRKDALDLIFSH